MSSFGVTDTMIASVRAALASVPPDDSLIPIENMRGYFISREHKEEGDEIYLFPLTIDAATVHIYLRI